MVRLMRINHASRLCKSYGCQTFRAAACRLDETLGQWQDELVHQLVAVAIVVAAVVAAYAVERFAISPDH